MTIPTQGEDLVQPHCDLGIDRCVCWSNQNLCAHWISAVPSIGGGEGDGPTDAFHLSCPNCGQNIDLFPSTEAPPLSLKEDEGPSRADSGGSRPQEAVKSEGPRGVGGEG